MVAVIELGPPTALPTKISSVLRLNMFQICGDPFEINGRNVDVILAQGRPLLLHVAVNLAESFRTEITFWR